MVWSMRCGELVRCSTKIVEHPPSDMGIFCGIWLVRCLLHWAIVNLLRRVLDLSGT